MGIFPDETHPRRLERKDGTDSINYRVHGIIYCSTNKVNGKVYIGQTTLSLEARMHSHGRDKKKNYFCSAVRKYGLSGFEWKEIDSAETQNELNAKESYWINFFDSMNREKGYNTNPGGRNFGRMSESTKKKISKTHMGFPGTMNGIRHTPEAIEKIRQSKIGKKRKPFTLIARIHMGDVRKGKPLRPEHRKKISEAVKASPATEAAGDREGHGGEGKRIYDSDPGGMSFFPSSNFPAKRINGHGYDVGIICLEKPSIGVADSVRPLDRSMAHFLGRIFYPFPIFSANHDVHLYDIWHGNLLYR